MKKKLYILSILSVCISLISCEKLLDDKADIQISDLSELIQTPQDAQSVLNGAYDVLVNGLDGQMQVIDELLSNNLTAPLGNSDPLLPVYQRVTNTFNGTTAAAYNEFYIAIFRANLLLRYAKDVSGLSSSELNRIEGEARFIRAMGHFWVLKTYAQPWGYTSDNSHLGIVIRTEPTPEPLPRNTVAEVYDFIKEDLIAAISALPEGNNVYASKYSAAALLAYVYFLQNDFANCVTYSDMVINSGQYTLEPTLDTFHAWDSLYQFSPNPEMIFGIKSNVMLNDMRNDEFNAYRKLSVQGARLSLTQECYNLFASNPLDQRNDWVLQDGSQYLLLRFGTQATNSDAINFFDIPVLRLTMIKLIRAESLGELGTNLSVAVDDINDIRERAFGNELLNLPGSAGSNEVIQAARLEFRKEMVGEGYWVDQLRRRGARGENIIIRNAPWNCNGMAIQFPQNEGSGRDFVFNPEGGCN